MFYFSVRFASVISALGGRIANALGFRSRKRAKRDCGFLGDSLSAGLAAHDGLASETQQAGKPGLREAELLAMLAVLLWAHSSM